MLEKIAKVLGEELTKQVETALKGAGLEIGVINDGTLVPAEKHDSLKMELKQAKAESEAANTKLTEVNTQIETLSKSKEAGEQVQEQLAVLKEDFDKYKREAERRVDSIKKQALVERGLLLEKANPDAVEYLVGLVDLSKIEVDEKGSIKDWMAVINTLKDRKKSLFADTIAEGGDINKGGEGGGDMNTWQEKYKAAKTNIDRIRVKQAAAAEGVTI